MYRWHGRYQEGRRRIEQMEREARAGRPRGMLQKHLPTRRDFILALAVLGTLAVFGLVLQFLGY